MKILLVSVALMSGSVMGAEADAEKLKALASSTLANIAASAPIVAAVKAQNAKGTSLDEVKKIDEKWLKTAGYDDFMKSLMNNDCARSLNDAAKANKFIVEAFVMDANGANVCMIDKTSDYWQGDEAKHEKSYAKGKGEIFVDKVKFDESTQSYIAQISVPVMDGGKAVGAVTFGVNVEAVK